MAGERYNHAFLGQGHAEAERNVWVTIALTVAMMAIEIAGGLWFGSIALVADGFHMSTHAGALLIAALAYTLARRHASDRRFTFGAGKFGDLAGFASAVALGIVAIEVAFEAAERLWTPTPVSYGEAIPIAALGFAVNLVSAWLLSRGGHHHHHGEEHAHDDARSLHVGGRTVRLSIFEHNCPPRFRLEGAGATEASVETVRPNGARQTFALRDAGAYLESVDIIPEPHAFEAIAALDGERASVRFDEAADKAVERDNNMAAAIVHVLADAAVSALVIVGLTLGYLFGWWFLDPLAALVGAVVIASWSYQLIRAAGAVLLDMNPDAELTARVRELVESQGDALADFHLWRLGPGHLGAIASIETHGGGGCADYRRKILGVARFSHLTVEVMQPEPDATA